MTHYEGGEVGDYQRGSEDPVSKVEYYLSPDRKWHWRVRAANGKIYDASSQGFWSKWNAKRNYRRGLVG